MTNKNQSPLFEGLSLEEPSILSISFESDPSASLGVKLCNHDNGMSYRRIISSLYMCTLPTLTYIIFNTNSYTISFICRIDK